MTVTPIGDPVDLPPSGRRFHSSRRVRLGDVTPKGRLRLDAVARYLQDIANDDAVDGRYSDIHGWVVRRTEMWVHELPRYMTDIELTTWCGGLGSHWAERRTSITSADGARIEAAALWVHVDLQTLKPSPLPPDFPALVAEASRGRTIRANLTIGKSLPKPDPIRVEPWHVRFADMDAVGHMNNAAYWIAAEEYLAGNRQLRAPFHATVEHHLPVDPGDEVGIETLEDDGRVVLRHVLTGGDVAAVTQLVRIS
jgi:acyl-ACP thioesterase